MTEVRLDVAFAHPAERVWRAVTDRRLLTEWFMPIVADPDDATRFQLHPRRLDGFSGPLNGEIIEQERPLRMVMRWHAEDLHVRVILTIEPTADGCRLTFVQRGFLGPKGTLRRRVLRTTYQRLLTESLPDALDWLATNDTLGTTPGGNLAPALRRTPAGGGKARRNDGGFRARRAPIPRTGADAGSSAGGASAEPAAGTPAEGIAQAVVDDVGHATAEDVARAATTAQDAATEADASRTVAVRARAAVPGARRADHPTRVADPGPPRTRRAARRRRDDRQLVRRSSAAAGVVPAQAPASPPQAPRTGPLPQPVSAVVRGAAATVGGLRRWNPEQRSLAVVLSGVLLLLVAGGLVVLASTGDRTEDRTPQPTGDRQSRAANAQGDGPAQPAGAPQASGVAAGGAVAATGTPAGLTGTYRTTASWEGGYRLEITLVNHGAGEIRGWTVRVTLPARGLAIGSVHGASYRQSGQVVTFTPFETTRSVGANGFLQFDFSLTGTGTMVACTVDGRTCQAVPG